MVWSSKDDVVVLQSMRDDTQRQGQYEISAMAALWTVLEVLMVYIAPLSTQDVTTPVYEER